MTESFQAELKQSSGAETVQDLEWLLPDYTQHIRVQPLLR